MEVLWTGLNSLLKKDFKLTARTSIWMFPIYGFIVFLEPLCNLIYSMPILLRGGIYSICIFIGEYVSGFILKRFNLCPWDYSKSKYNISGIIRLDYAPVWFMAGLVFETVYELVLKNNFIK